MPNDIPSNHLVSAAELLEKSLRRFGRLFSSMFPWLVMACIGSLLLALSKQATSIWTLLLGVIGVCILFFSYVAAARIVSGVEKDPKDILANSHASFRLFFSYLWIIILECFIFLGGSILIVPALIFSIYVAVAPYVLVVENVRGMKALTRSWSYVSGRWWAVLWRILVFGFLVVVALVLVTMILGLILTPAAISAGSIAGSSPHQMSLGLTIIQQIIDAFFFLPIALCFMYELYSDVVRTKAAPDAEKTGTLWLNVFLIIGLVIAFIWVFFASGRAVASITTFRYHLGRHQ